MKNSGQRVLFPAESVEWLKVDKNSPIVLGVGRQGIVYKGRLKFKNGRPKQVAVKFFDQTTRKQIKNGAYAYTRSEPPYSKMDGQRTRKTLKIIRDLYAAGVRMPKFGIVSHEGQNVLVSSLFGRGGESKITELDGWFGDYAKERELTLGLLSDAAKIFNAGWMPNRLEDVFHVEETPRGKTHLIGEVDPVHYKRLEFEKRRQGDRRILYATAVREFMHKLARDRNFYNKAFRTFYIGLDRAKRKPFLEGYRDWFGQDEEITVSKVLQQLAERNL
ncbi:hypothetical protein HY995_03285 [Candidatus Micrarchaeota archaeon]|nr:hypothetical protein [Candidatus Micrarchaeota archaeon]MBI5177085.1 hypothetical protein [Candidatus Micrarchaeota archaeon]